MRRERGEEDLLCHPEASASIIKMKTHQLCYASRCISKAESTIGDCAFFKKKIPIVVTSAQVL